jgi:hypothetical protein
MRSIAVCLIPIVCLASGWGCPNVFAQTSYVTLNPQGCVINAPPSGTRQCPLGEADEIVCDGTRNCSIVGPPACYEIGGGTVTTPIEVKVLNSGAATTVDVFTECPPGGTDCKKLNTLDVIACHSIRDCVCIAINGNQVCTYGSETIYQLIRYQRSDKPCLGGPVDP